MDLRCALALKAAAIDNHGRYDWLQARYRHLGLVDTGVRAVVLTL
jgi:hypothetical protein